MTLDNLLLLVAGMLLTTLAVVVFLLSLRYGLKRGKWLPLIAVTSLWLLAMLIYAFSESRDLEGSTRQRISAGEGVLHNPTSSGRWLATNHSH